MTEQPNDQLSPDSSAAYAENVSADEIRTPEERRRVMLSWLVGLLAIGVFSVRYPAYAFGAFMFAITLSTLVFVHEWGHYQFALWAGMRVKRFAIGFPPFVYTKRRNNIDYSIGALPIGGMVDIAGLGSEEEMVGSAKGTTSTHAAPDKNKPFGQKNFQDASLGWRFLTLFAGPLMNFVFALFIFVAFYSLIGEPQKAVPTNIVDLVEVNTPAFRAGLQSDDKIIGVNGVKMSDSQKIGHIIRGGGVQPVSLMVQRDAKVLNLKLTPELDDVLGDTKGKKVPMIGISWLINYSNFEKVGVFNGPKGAWDGAIGRGLQVSYFQAEQIFGLLRRVVTLNMTERDKRSVGGPVKIAQAVNHSARRSWQQWISVAGALSLNLGLMNLLPIPALDGGRIMFIIYEAITRRPFDARKEGLVNAVGMAMVLMFMLFMTFRDVLPFITRSMQ